MQVSELYKTPRLLSLAERRWIAQKVMALPHDLDAFVQDGQVLVDQMTVFLNAYYVPKHTEQLDAQCIAALLQMPEPLHFMLFDSEPAKEHLLPLAHQRGLSLLLRMFRSHEPVGAYMRHGWLLLEALAESNCINQHWQKRFAELYGIMCAWFQASCIHDSEEFLRQHEEFVLTRQEKVPGLATPMITLRYGHVRVAVTVDPVVVLPELV